MTDTHHYCGDELQVFAHAVNWKRYWHGKIKRYICGEVLEVGAGLGSNTRLLCHDAVDRWTCLEPDDTMYKHLLSLRQAGNLPSCVKCFHGTVDSMDTGSLFDVVLYIDVLEHIEEDREELRRAAECTTSGGFIVVLSPAIQFLFTDFDRRIGHYRRYTCDLLKKIVPDSCAIETIVYLDSVGMMASLANKLLLHQSQPSIRQVKIWDRLLVPFSNIFDSLFRYRFGKSILLILQKN